MKEVSSVVILNGGGLPTLQRCRRQYPGAATHLGRLARPRHCGKLRETLDAGFPVGVDNDAFSDWNPQRFVAQIGRIEHALWGRAFTLAERLASLAPLGLPPAHAGLSPARPPVAAWHPNLLFVTAPDVPFDAAATARRFADWAPMLSHLPLALCIQDGAADVDIPWGWPNLRCLFMAGSTAFKLSRDMADICHEGADRGLHIHAGRVNSRTRIRYLLDLGFVDSIDGSGFDRFRDTHLPWALQEVSAADS